MKTQRWLVAGCAVLSAAGLVGACSGSSDSDDGNGGSGNASGSSGSGGSGNVSGSGTGASGFGGTGVSGGAGASGEAGAGGDNGETCGTSTQKAVLTPANLLFVIDKSGSMNCNPPEGDEVLNAMCGSFPRKENPNLPSKWEVTRDALANALDTLAGQPNIRAGITVFPKTGLCGVDDTPEVDIAPLDAAQRTEIADVLDAVTPVGETPIAGATILSYSHLADAIRAGDIDGNTFVVLLTDGAETCRPSELPKLVEEDVPNARLYNIRTFVIGAPGSEQARGLLSQIAWEGGTASSPRCDHSASQPDEGDCHFDMTESADLATDLNAALETISRTKVLSCEFAVPENPDGGGVNLNKVNVTFTPGGGDPEQIPKDDTEECDAADGWQYSEDFSKIVLCGEVCDRVQADSSGRVSIVLGCPTVIVK